MIGEKFSEETVDLSLISEWLRWMERSKGRSPRTVKMYRRILQGLVVRHDKPLRLLTAEDIERWVQQPRGGRAQGNVGSPATQARDVAAVRSFFTWAVAKGHVASNPCVLVATPPIRNVQPRPISDGTWLALWDGVADGTVESGNRDADLIALGLGFFGGLRREELTRLQVKHLDLTGRSLVHFTRKGGGEDALPVGTMLTIFERRLPHLRADRLWPVLRRVGERRAGNDFVLGWADLGRPRARVAPHLAPGQCNPHAVNAWLERLCRRAGVGHFSPHALRHSAATNLLRAGVPLPAVSRLMNHSNVHTTMRYVKVSGLIGEWLDHLGE